MMIRVETTAPGLDDASTNAVGALGELYARHAPGARRLAYFLTGDRELADDLVQDAFVRLAGRFRHRRQPDAFDAYLRRTVVNLFTSHLRRLRLERRELARQRSDRDRDHRDDDLAERDELWTALQTLAPRQRAAIVLRYYEDLSERETADIMRCSLGAAKQLITRGLAALRERIGDEDA
jgi:RNA polymerase sigma-70 factor (sigma-E family)